MSKESLRKQYGLTADNLSKEELEVLHLNDALIKRLSSYKGIGCDKFGKSDEEMDMRDRIMAEVGDKATANCECIIDKVALLTRPLNDPRTSPTLRKVYIEQEELMVALSKIEQEELEEVEVYSCAGRTSYTPEYNISKPMTEAEVQRFKESGKEFLVKLYGVVPKDFCTQPDTQLCSECPYFKGECQ
jgi:hypothetical protein